MTADEIVQNVLKQIHTLKFWIGYQQTKNNVASFGFDVTVRTTRLNFWCEKDLIFWLKSQIYQLLKWFGWTLIPVMAQNVLKNCSRRAEDFVLKNEVWSVLCEWFSPDSCLIQCVDESDMETKWYYFLQTTFESSIWFDVPKWTKVSNSEREGLKWNTRPDARNLETESEDKAE